MGVVVLKSKACAQVVGGNMMTMLLHLVSNNATNAIVLTCLFLFAPPIN